MPGLATSLRRFAGWAAVVVAGLGMPEIAVAQLENCVTSTHLVSDDGRRSRDQLRFEALQQARNSLLTTLGVRVGGVTQVTLQGTGTESSTGFSRSIIEETRGYITRDSILSFRTPDGGRSWELRYQGCAKLSEGQPDPSFTARIRLDKNPPAYAVAGSALAQRDSIVAWISASRAAFFTVFHRSGDTLRLIYPSRAIASPHRTVVLPDQELRVPPAGARLRVRLEDGVAADEGWIIAVATKREIPLPASWDAGSMAVHALTWHQYGEWLNRIPLDERVTAQHPFTVERTTPR
jgi:hypothetical protein